MGSQKSIHRVYDLIAAPAQLRFLSLEPLHGPVSLPLNESVDYANKVKDLIGWVIVGGESGNENGKYLYRPCEFSWITNIVHDCMLADVPVFVKQLGTHLAKQLKLQDRHGGNIDEWPASLQIREMPEGF
ncbi:hypothetical protein BWI97_15790 [Siphonobacter sp. BAB-5405]|nr:hypothetical protein BWI97_15790 [Siphonobacter sp. BAB-5405]